MKKIDFERITRAETEKIKREAVNKISDITWEEVVNFNNKENYYYNTWIQDIAIPAFAVTVRFRWDSTTFKMPLYFKQLNEREFGVFFKNYPDTELKRFDPERPIIECVVCAEPNLRAGLLIGTLKSEPGKMGDAGVFELYSSMHDAFEDCCTELITIFSYVNCIFLTQPPKKGKTRIEKVHETLFNGQVISHPQKVTFYQLPEPEQINYRKIAAYQREWHCPAWGVRGHYRHYKSGKVVFIKSYVKGKDKSKYEGREYDIGLIAKGGTGR